MKIVVLGGTGLIGSQLCRILEQQGHEVIAASPSSGVNSQTGEGLDEVLKGASVVVDVSNSPSFADDPVMEFFAKGTNNLVSAARKAGIGHFVILSVVGTSRLQQSGYFRAKQAQEDLLERSGLSYTIVHATQFFEFIPGILAASTGTGVLRLSTGQIQPIASADVAALLADSVLGEPVSGITEIAGPTRFSLASIVQHFLDKTGDERELIADPAAPYFGTPIDDSSLVPGNAARIGKIDFEAWFAARKPMPAVTR